MERFRDNQSDLFSLEIDETAKSTFLEMARWTKFLAIFGFILMGLVMVLGVFVALVWNNLPPDSPFVIFGPLGTVVYFLVIVGIMFYPFLALFKFSTGVKSGLNAVDKLQFNASIKALKNTFKYWGIMTIVLLAIYGIAIVIAIIYGVMNR